MPSTQRTGGGAILGLLILMLASWVQGNCAPQALWVHEGTLWEEGPCLGIPLKDKVGHSAGVHPGAVSESTRHPLGIGPGGREGGQREGGQVPPDPRTRLLAPPLAPRSPGHSTPQDCALL